MVEIIDLLLMFGAVFLWVIVVPIVVYLSAKMGSYGWLKGKYLFWEDHRSHKKGKHYDNTSGT